METMSTCCMMCPATMRPISGVVRVISAFKPDRIDDRRCSVTSLGGLPVERGGQQTVAGRPVHDWDERGDDRSYMDGSGDAPRKQASKDRSNQPQWIGYGHACHLRVGSKLTMSPSPRANRQRALIAFVQVLGLTVWFSASAVVPTLQSEWRITAAAAVWLTASVQVGFVVGAVTSVLLTLADRCRPHVLLAWCTAGAACSTVVLAVVVDSLAPAILLRFFIGVFLAGVYPVGMKLMATWSEPSTRGKAFGVLFGALTLGSAMPHLLGGLGNLPWCYVMGAAAAIALTGALIAAIGIRPGPYSEKRPDQPNSRYSLTMFREHAPRLVNIGYLGHMWELYALWAWLPTYVMASQKSGNSGLGSQFSLELFIVVGIAGVAGCLLGGWASDRWGRSRTAVVALAVSGSCCYCHRSCSWADGYHSLSSCWSGAHPLLPIPVFSQPP